MQFKHGNLVQTTISSLAASGLSPRRFEFEITETVLLSNTEEVLRALHQLRALGVRIALDDFGTGFSSLSYLRTFPFDKLKIDQSFLQDLVSKPESKAIVNAISALGRSLGMTTTAEGVETAEQLRLIREQGYTEVQGYFFSPPVTAVEAVRLLQKPDQFRDDSRPIPPSAVADVPVDAHCEHETGAALAMMYRRVAFRQA